MRNASVILSAALFAVLLASCSGGAGGGVQSAETLFRTVCSADEALELARESGAVVIERRGCTSGGEAWDDFFRTASGGSPASVLCAHYYTLDRESVSGELYAREKDRYPVLYFYLVAYDGTEYSVSVRESAAEEPEPWETYRHLLRFTGDAPPTARYAAYDNYVLVDDPAATWEGIMVYRNYSGWKEGGGT